jgi:hypothetical protein
LLKTYEREALEADEMFDEGTIEENAPGSSLPQLTDASAIEVKTYF